MLLAKEVASPPPSRKASTLTASREQTLPGKGPGPHAVQRSCFQSPTSSVRSFGVAPLHGIRRLCLNFNTYLALLLPSADSRAPH